MVIRPHLEQHPGPAAGGRCGTRDPLGLHWVSKVCHPQPTRVIISIITPAAGGAANAAALAAGHGRVVCHARNVCHATQRAGRVARPGARIGAGLQLPGSRRVGDVVLHIQAVAVKASCCHNFPHDQQPQRSGAGTWAVWRP